MNCRITRARHGPEIREQPEAGRYRPQPVERADISKSDGKTRPLEIPTVLDRFIQQAIAQVVSAQWEPRFHRPSHGFRPDRSAHQAVREVQAAIREGYGWVVDMDLQAFFDRVNYDRLMVRLKSRGMEADLMRLINWYLKTGVSIDGNIEVTTKGVPQGGPLSPILANIYLHYALDRWFENVAKPGCRGQAILIRYAGDFVRAFQYRREAQRFYQAMPKQLNNYALDMAEEKTRIQRFSRFRPGLRNRFSFLGFELYWNRDRRGDLRVMKRTARKKLRGAKRRMKEWIKAKRHVDGKLFINALNRKLIGHYNYYGVRSNEGSLGSFFSFTIRCAYKWLKNGSTGKAGSGAVSTGGNSKSRWRSWESLGREWLRSVPTRSL